jgi:uncharacterized protein YdeI (YjbR/CyaY-like superfamily)
MSGSLTPTDVVFFESPAELRAWLERHHAEAAELWLGFYKKGAGRPSVTYHEAVDEALCFGWIDGVRKGLDADSYTNRFTPRKPNSYWSRVNVRRAEVLISLGRMHPSGRAAFDARDPARTEQYSFERETSELDSAYAATFRANGPAWAFFEAQPPSYRRAAIWWVMSAKKEETRLRRLATLIDDSAHGRRLAMLARPSKA